MKINIELNLEEIEYLKKGLMKYIRYCEWNDSEWTNIYDLYMRLVDKGFELNKKE